MKTQKRVILNPNTLDLAIHSANHGISFPDESLTVQSELEQSDINTIVRNFGITHQLPYGNDIPRYDDFTNAPSDYHQAANFIAETDALFLEYPAEIRARFDNDPGKFLNFVSDDSNYDEAITLGLVPQRPDNPPPTVGGGVSTPPPEGGGDKP